jgi:predicted RNase H-like HicB family nuclease
MDQAFTAVFESCEEGGFHAFVPEIPGVHTEGETIEETAKNLADALQLFLLDGLLDEVAKQKQDANRFEVQLVAEK